jgi:predicted transposase/invertase (TIGR01784 family)
LRESFSDVVWSCPLRGTDSSVKVSFLFEHKSSPESYPHLQLLEYMLGMYNAALKDGEPLPFVLPIVVYHGEKDWHYRPFSDYYPVLPESFRPYLPHFEYQLTDLSNYSIEELRSKGEGGLYNVFLALKRAREFAFIRDKLYLLLIGIPDDLSENLYQAIIVYALKNIDRPKEELDQIIINAFSKLQDPKIMNSYDILMNHCRQEGRQEGLEKGIEKGIRVLLRTTDMPLKEIANELECDLDLVIKVSNELNAR